MFERKYKIQDGKLVNKKTQTPIPKGEPVFILTGRDRKALGALMAYNAVLDTLEMKAEIAKVINDFRIFQAENKNAMEEPTP